MRCSIGAAKAMDRCVWQRCRYSVTQVVVMCVSTAVMITYAQNGRLGQIACALIQVASPPSESMTIMNACSAEKEDRAASSAAPLCVSRSASGGAFHVACAGEPPDRQGETGPDQH